MTCLRLNSDHQTPQSKTTGKDPPGSSSSSGYKTGTSPTEAGVSSSPIVCRSPSAHTYARKRPQVARPCRFSLCRERMGHPQTRAHRRQSHRCCRSRGARTHQTPAMNGAFLSKCANVPITDRNLGDSRRHSHGCVDARRITCATSLPTPTRPPTTGSALHARAAPPVHAV